MTRAWTAAIATAAVAAAGVLAPGAAAKPGDIIVGDSGSAQVLRVKPKTGATTVISDDPRFAAPSDTVFDREGMIYVVDYDAFGGGGGVFRVNPRNGNTRVVSDDPIFEQPDGLALAPNGDLFVTEIDTAVAALLRVRLPGGETSVVSQDPLLDGGPIGVVVPPSGVPVVGDSDLVARVDPLSGAATAIANAGDGLDGGEGLTRGADGTLYMADNVAGVHSIDPRTGTVRDISGPVPYDGYGMAFDHRGRVLLTSSDEITAVNVRTGATSQVADGFSYAEGMEVEPPRCAGETATIVGTTGKDVLKGSRFADVIHALGGNDKVKGKGGRDVICGGSGNDTLDGGPKRDVCKGQGGRDRTRRC